MSYRGKLSNMPYLHHAVPRFEEYLQRFERHETQKGKKARQVALQEPRVHGGVHVANEDWCLRAREAAELFAEKKLT